MQTGDTDDITTTDKPPVESSSIHRSTEAASKQWESYVQEIGLLTVRHSTLDHALRLLISNLSSVKSTTGEMLMQRMSTRQLLSIFKRLTDKLVAKQSPQQRQWVLDFRKRAYEVNEKRNDVVHALWTFDHLGRGSRVHKLRTVPPADLENFPDEELKELVRLNWSLGRLIGNAFDLLNYLETVDQK